MTAAEGLSQPITDEGLLLLSRFGIDTPAEVTVGSVDEVFTATAAFAKRVVLKAVSPDLVHKSDVGGVVVGIESAQRARAEALAMSSRVPDLTGFQVQEFVEGSLELVLGLCRDPILGAFVVAGLGGIWVEVLDDVAIRPVPCSHDEARKMLRELRAAPLLAGARGAEPVDQDAIADVIEALSRMAQAHPEIEQVDLNPVVVRAGRAVALDRHIVRVESAQVEVPSREGDRGQDRMESLLNPESIAVVGASADTDKVGGRLFRYLVSHGFERPLFPVNPKAEPVMGRTAYRNIADLPVTPDLACVVVPVAAALPVVRECVEAGIPAVTVYSSGFAEAGADGRDIQDQLRMLSATGAISIAGPNTAGIINTHASMCAAITMACEDPNMPAGNIGVITQSGGLGSAMLTRLWDKGAGISSWISCGNEVDLTLSDYLGHLVEDPDTDVLVLFIEALRETKRFAAACNRARQLGKPILAYKTGTTEIGRAAVQSHTAAVAGDDKLYDALFRSLGVVRCNDLQGLLDAAVALSWQPVAAGNRVAVVSTSGGACSMTADACARAGLALPTFSEDSLRAIRKVIPAFGTSTNPVDVTLGASTHPRVVGDVVEAIMDEPDTDAILVVLSSNASTPALRMAEHLVSINEHLEKPLVIARIAAEYLATEALQLYRTHGIPVYSTPERAVAVVASMVAAGRTGRC